MFTRAKVRRFTIVGVGAVLACALAGGVIAAQFGAFEDPEAFVSAVEEAPIVRVATIRAAGGRPSRGVFVETTSTGQFCLWDAPTAGGPQRMGGCNTIEDPLGGAKLSASLAYQGGPQATRVTDARLIGLIASDVASVQVLMSDGSRRAIPIASETAVAYGAVRYRAFGYRFDVAQFGRGIEPDVVLALDANGHEIDRQATGFGG